MGDNAGSQAIFRMQLQETRKPEGSRRFERFNIVFPILLAGWVPSILTLVVSYTILSKTLESKILRDRQTFVQLIGHMVGDDLSRRFEARHQHPVQRKQIERHRRGGHEGRPPVAKP